MILKSTFGKGDSCMRRMIVTFALAFAIAIVMAQGVQGQQGMPDTPGKPELTEDQLVDRFNKALELELDQEGVFLTFKAAEVLDGLVRNAAREIVSSKKFEELPTADKNFQVFAKTVKSKAKLPFGTETRIDQETIHRVLSGGSNPAAYGGWLKGLCPLFPICK